jgi:hypothetical protein
VKLWTTISATLAAFALVAAGPGASAYAGGAVHKGGSKHWTTYVKFHGARAQACHRSVQQDGKTYQEILMRGNGRHATKKVQLRQKAMVGGYWATDDFNPWIRPHHVTGTDKWGLFYGTSWQYGGFQMKLLTKSGTHRGTGGLVRFIDVPHC